MFGTYTQTSGWKHWKQWAQLESYFVLTVIRCHPATWDRSLTTLLNQSLPGQTSSTSIWTCLTVLYTLLSSLYLLCLRLLQKFPPSLSLLSLLQETSKEIRNNETTRIQTPAFCGTPVISLLWFLVKIGTH